MQDQPAAAAWQRRKRFQKAVQRTRFASFSIASLCGFLSAAVGILDVSFSEAVVLGGAGMASAAVYYLLIEIDLSRRFGRAWDWLWLLTDAALISWVVVRTGGVDSPWYLWYLANIAGAAFVLGQLAAFLVFLIDTTGLLAPLVVAGDIHRLDASLWQPVARMVFLYGASFLFLRGVAMLQDRRQVIKSMRDTEARRVEELTRLTAALDQRTREIADANLRIREADRLKSQFLANMSHELRTPLNSIIGFSDVLLAKLPGDFPPKYVRFLRTINSSGQHLLRIINDLLDLSKIEAGKMELNPESIPVLTTIEGVCAIMRGTAKERDIKFDIDVPTDLPDLEADPVKLKQILFNLVSNATKFSDDGSTVTITAALLPAGDTPLGCETIQIAVVDRGVGIDPRDHRLIFEEFRQVDGSSTRAFGGTGLGLALVMRLVELHRGTIKVDSAVGEGSTFTVTLPREFQGEVSTDREGVPQTLDIPAEGGRRILVVEDDPTAYESISSHLNDADYIPLRARNSDEALRLAKLLKPAAITLDIILPGLDGWEILRLLRQDPETVDIPVVIVSVLDNRELALTLGAQDYLTKPVNGEELVARLVDLIPRTIAGHPRVLLIDDEPELHDLVEAKLVPLGYRVEHALSGAEGLQTARQHRFDLVLLDLMMEDLDGFEVAARLHAEDIRVPVVVLTAKEVTRLDRERLHGKIEALVGKTEMPRGRLVSVIEAVLDRQQKEGARA